MLMTCRHVRQLHDAYVDGELSPSLMAEVHAHLLQCPECQQQVEMLRACGTVINGDESEPVLDSGFASRVVASFQQATPRIGAVLETRRARRQRLWRGAISVSLPAAAAVLFFSILIWPSEQTPVGPRVVAGKAVDASGVGDMVHPTLDAMADTKQAAESLNQLLEIAGSEARQGVEEGLGKVPRPAASPLDLLLEPFSGLLEPRPPEATEGDDEPEIVRF